MFATPSKSANPQLIFAHSPCRRWLRLNDRNALHFDQITTRESPLMPPERI